MKAHKFLILSLLLLGGCIQSYNDGEEELRIVPVTNNPNLLPQGSGGMVTPAGPF